YYLHPQYRGAGIKQSQFARIAGIAGRLWTKMASSSAKKSDLEILKAQLRQYTCNEEPYNGSYESTIDSPIRWWKTTGDGTKTKPDIELFSEVNDEDDFDDFDNSTDYIDPEIEHQDLELENFIDLNNIEQD
ncbi:3609_t:CDS:2, partial [Dentiscutata erythropus]